MTQPDASDGEREYKVRLLFKLPANSPFGAVQSFTEQVINHGLRDWTYFVEDPESGDAWYVNGYGKVEPVFDSGDDDEWDLVDEDAQSSPRTPDPHVSKDIDGLIRLGRA